MASSVPTEMYTIMCMEMRSGDFWYFTTTYATKEEALKVMEEYITSLRPNGVRVVGRIVPVEPTWVAPSEHAYNPEK